MTMWACIVMGAIVTGLNGWWTGPELAYGVELTQPKLLIGDEPRLERIAESGARVDAPIVRWDELAAKVADAALPTFPTRRSTSTTRSSSSSRAAPRGGRKGGALSHATSSTSRSVAACAAPRPRCSPTPPNRSPMAAASLCAGPFFHISGICPDHDGRPVLRDLDRVHAAGTMGRDDHLELTEKHRIATWTGVPTMYWRLIEHPDFDSYDLTCLTAISSAVPRSRRSSSDSCSSASRE